MVEQLDTPKVPLCNCMSKSSEVAYHDEYCPLRLVAWIEALERDIEIHDQIQDANFVVRPQTTMNEVKDQIAILVDATEKRLYKHGYGISSGPHEIFGIIAEEVDELIDEMRANNHDKFYDELVDIAVAAIYRMVSIQHRIDFEEYNQED